MQGLREKIRENSIVDRPIGRMHNNYEIPAEERKNIIDKCKIYQINMKPADFKEAYRIFKRFSLIDYSDDIATEEGKVRLYPSLQFCMDIGQLKQVMAEYAPEGETAQAEGDEYLESEDADE